MTQTVVVERKDRRAVSQKVLPDGLVPSPYSLGAALRHGGIFTWASIPVMGLGNIMHRQFVKGVLFLAIEIVFIYFLLRSGVHALAGLGKLGPVTKAGNQWVTGPDGKQVFENINATNSVEVLLFGIAWIFIVAAFALVWMTAVRSAYQAQVHAGTTT
ncbi:MAG: hypothetical protein FWF28_03225, partial [Micrococcales bacterium]|nr:hypothetical protein [Micrococcales bacterium]